MKTRILTTIILTTLSAAAIAQSEVKENTVVNKPEKVTITRDNQKVTIAIDGKEGNPEYRYYNQFDITGETTETINETEDKREWNFSLPFDKILSADRKNNKTDKYHRPDFTGFGIGMVTAVNADKDVDIDMSASYEFTWTILSFSEDHNPQKHWGHAIGFGLNWRNYRMTGRKRFIQDAGQLTTADYPDGANPDFSRIKIFSLTVPFTVSYSLNRHMDLQFAPTVNFNTYASVKTRYKTDDGKQKDFFKGIHQRHVTLDLQTKLSYDDIGLYIKYSPFTPLNTHLAPAFRGLSIGIILGCN